MSLTFIARNPYTRQIGAVIASGSDDCVGGSLYFKDGVGLVSVQGRGQADMGMRALGLMAQGMGAPDILKDLERHDSALELRQIMLAPLGGDLTVRTGGECIAWAGHACGAQHLAAGNMLTSDQTLAAMERAYNADRLARMERRLFAALQAGVAQGGDVRGHRSAGLIILGGRDATNTRVTASVDPLNDLWQKIS